MRTPRTRTRIELGDFQTPPALAKDVASLLARRGCAPASVLEPTCGAGAFVDAALDAFPSVRQLIAFDVDADHVARTRVRLARSECSTWCDVANVFDHDWPSTLAAMAEPILIVGNPPWATASGLGALESANVPRKENFQRHRGLDARTGKSNFDVAEWMLVRLLEAAGQRDATIAMLVKTGVARRVLAHAWRTGMRISSAEMLRFDAGLHFGVAAHACLLICRTAPPAETECTVRDLARPDEALARIGWRDGTLVADVEAYDRTRSLASGASNREILRWRSGVKHDCSAVMELRRDGEGALVGGDGAPLELEADYVYPLLKGTDLAHGRVAGARRWLLVTQSRPGDDTSAIAARAPRTWKYLCRHAERLDARRSSIYRKRPRFSVFGVGPYTFAPWKVAISALHKRLSFAVVGPVGGRPVVFDDTCYHLSCETADAAALVKTLLESPPAREFLQATIFWDSKRPITADVLQRLDLERVAARLGHATEFAQLMARTRAVSRAGQA